LPHSFPNSMPLTKQDAAPFASRLTNSQNHFLPLFSFIDNAGGRGLKPQVDAGTSSPKPKPQMRTVLVVDDDDHFRRALIGNLLELSGFEIDPDEARSGEETLERVSGGHRFDRIFLDIKLPGIDGIETYQKIKSLDPSVRVIMMTSDPIIAFRAESALGKKVYDKWKLYLELNSILSNNIGENES
jgi:CheY-like chemotaxis protein